MIEALGLGPAAVAGLSWGGIVAQELYRRRPELVAGLILADTYAGWAGSLPAEACAARLASCLNQSTMPAGTWSSSGCRVCFPLARRTG